MGILKLCASACEELSKISQHIDIPVHLQTWSGVLPPILEEDLR